MKSAANKKTRLKTVKQPSVTGKLNGSGSFTLTRNTKGRFRYVLNLSIGRLKKSWAIPKGPDLSGNEKRLAILLNDIGSFKDLTKKTPFAGNENWDKGNLQPVDALHESISETEAERSFQKGELKFQAAGKKIKGEFVLVRLKDDPKNWLLIKHKYSETLQTGRAKKITKAKAAGSGKIPVPGFVSPMLATLTKIPFDDPDWIFEIKWDGFRAVAHTGKEIKLYSRNGLDFSTKFPGITKALGKIKTNCILDGEIVLFNEKGLPDFQKLQHYESNRQYPLFYYVFDILFREGKDLLQVSLSERKELLRKTVSRQEQVRYCDHVEEKGIDFFELSKKRGLEGIIAKKKDSLYYPGVRTREWLKIKNVLSTEAVIVGYTEPKGGRLHFGSLILANKKGKSWIYRGHAGTGFNKDRLSELKAKMDKLTSSKSPFDVKVPVNGKVTWIKPKLVADIAYTEITRDNIFRHPVFLHLREDKKLKDLNEE